MAFWRQSISWSIIRRVNTAYAFKRNICVRYNLRYVSHLNVRKTRQTDYNGGQININRLFNGSRMIIVKHTLVLGHYVKHCRLTDKASIQVTEAAGELAGVAAVALCLPRRGCTLPPGNFSSSKPRARKTREALLRKHSAVGRSCNIPSPGIRFNSYR